ncbi:hypothetical protein EBB07_09880 [Paenibacillaceae bacterium]|nr:hypothetical protein EBB07_09880 [Paenibacillaceae bacterium]
MSQKILPLDKSPITSYQNASYFLSISLSSDDARPWMYSNFIQLYTSEGDREVHFYKADDLKFYPWLDYVQIDKLLIMQHKIDIFEWIKNYVDREHYIHIFLNKYYVSGTSYYHEINQVHDLLIRGYDEVKGQVYISAYNERGVYASWWIPIGDVIQGFATEQYDSNEMTLKASAIKCNRHYSYQLDLNNMLELSRDYLFSRNTSKRTSIIASPMYRTYGIEVYDKITMLLYSSKRQVLDLRPLRVLWEHKKIMVQRIKFLKEHNIFYNTDLEQGFKQIEDETNTVRNIALKYNMSQNQKLVHHIISKLSMIKERESRLFKILVNEMEAASIAFKWKNRQLEHLWQFFNEYFLIKETYDDPEVAVQITELLYAVGKDKAIIDILLFRMPIDFVPRMFVHAREKAYELFVRIYEIIKDRLSLHQVSFINHLTDKYKQLFLHVEDAPFRESILQELDFLYSTYRRQEILELKEKLLNFRT